MTRSIRAIRRRTVRRRTARRWTARRRFGTPQAG